MSKTDLFHQVSRLRLDEHTLPWVLVGMGLVIVLVGIGGLVWQSNQPLAVVDDVSQPAPHQAAPDSFTASRSAEILVDVAGAVNQPGIYRLQLGQRIASALEAAGGISADADPVFVNQQLNLAEKLNDGDKLYIPTLEERLQSEQLAVRASQADAESGSDSLDQAGGKVSINTSSKKELEKLTGVGEVRAAAIVSGRPYSSLTELKERKILPQNVLDENRASLAL